jgi:hypothetical protein
VSCCGSPVDFLGDLRLHGRRAVEVSALDVELDARALERTDQAVERPYLGRRQIVARALIFLDREPVHARTGGELLQRPAKQTAGGLKLDASDPNCGMTRKYGRRPRKAAYKMFSSPLGLG